MPRACADVLELYAGQHTCGARIEWCAAGNCGQGMTRDEAEAAIAAEFPSVCGPCGLSTTSAPSQPASTSASCRTDGGVLNVSISDRAVLLSGETLHIKGVCWNPVPLGAHHPPSQANLLEYAATDGEMMRLAGINVVRS